MFRKGNRLNIAAAIKSGGQAENEAIQALINGYRDRIVKFILNNRGSREEADDTFMEGLTETILMIKRGKFKGESTVPTFLYGTCKYLWFNKLKRKKVQARYLAQLQEEDFVDRRMESRLISKEQKGRILELFAAISDKCRELIRLRTEGYSHEMIAEALALKSPAAAMTEGSRCRSKLKALLKARPDVRQLLAELFDAYPSTPG
jgi:RNA polymerase sigma factor (sigma-70 family)